METANLLNNFRKLLEKAEHQMLKEDHPEKGLHFSDAAESFAKDAHGFVGAFLNPAPTPVVPTLASTIKSAIDRLVNDPRE